MIHGTGRDTLGQPLSGANVSVQGTTRRTVTNQAGEFRLRFRPEERQGAMVVGISYLGMEGVTRTVPADAEGEFRVDAVMVPREITLDGIVVNAVEGAQRAERFDLAHRILQFLRLF